MLHVVWLRVNLWQSNYFGPAEQLWQVVEVNQREAAAAHTLWEQNECSTYPSFCSPWTTLHMKAARVTTENAGPSSCLSPSGACCKTQVSGTSASRTKLWRKPIAVKDILEPWDSIPKCWHFSIRSQLPSPINSVLQIATEFISTPDSLFRSLIFWLLKKKIGSQIHSP